MLLCVRFSPWGLLWVKSSTMAFLHQTVWWILLCNRWVTLVILRLLILKLKSKIYFTCTIHISKCHEPQVVVSSYWSIDKGHVNRDTHHEMFSSSWNVLLDSADKDSVEFRKRTWVSESYGPGFFCTQISENFLCSNIAYHDAVQVCVIQVRHRHFKGIDYAL